VLFLFSRSHQRAARLFGVNKRSVYPLAIAKAYTRSHPSDCLLSHPCRVLVACSEREIGWSSDSWGLPGALSRYKSRSPWRFIL